LNDIREQLFVLFQTEHAEHLQQIHSMLALAENVEGGPGEELLDEAFRRAHSLKGAARAVDLRPVEGLAHRLETLFSQVRDGKLRLDRQVGGVIRQVLDASADCMASWETDRTAPEPVGALRAIEAILGVSSDMSPAAPSPSLPRPSAALQPVETVRVTGGDLDRVMRSTAQILMEAQRQNTLTEQVREVSDQVRELAKEWDRFRKASTALARLSAQPKAPVLDRSIAVLDHRVRSLAMHSRTTYRSLQNNVWRMRHCGRELQRDVWRARLVPAESLVEGFRKMVRDLARDEKKEIDFRVIGAEAQADRMVLQRLKDPSCTCCATPLVMAWKLPGNAPRTEKW
jgi:two-component system chemotaxis sensor kinase CheA